MQYENVYRRFASELRQVDIPSAVNISDIVFALNSREVTVRTNETCEVYNDVLGEFKNILTQEVGSKEKVLNDIAEHYINIVNGKKDTLVLIYVDTNEVDREIILK